ncbi:MAG TPA: glycine--tRNA ligase subunit beta [Thermoleophilia bacterium]|nr:glycine--tRNA ligase subunit beta [Thermoleophilia bacterium]
MSLLLVEIGCEELPASFCRSVLRQLRGDGGEGLVYCLLADERLLPAEDGEEDAAESAAGSAADGAAARFAGRRLRVYVSPRRIVVLVEGVPERQHALVQRFRGPRSDIAFDAEGHATKAGAGFARGKGLRSEDLGRETVGGVEFVSAEVEAERRPALDVLPGLIPRLITGIQVPRGMRWDRRPEGADDYLRFARPIRWLAGKLDDATLATTFYGLDVGDVSQGHRVLGAPVAIAAADQYEARLAEQKVVVDQEERRRRIVAGLEDRAAALGARWEDPGDVLEEVVYLAEWPSVQQGRFDERHLRLPAPVLVTAMQSHQRYFPVRAADGGLAPVFLYVSNADPAAAELVTRGNERVLDGRLDDAEFAYDRDLAEGVDAMAARLGEVVFHEKLGTLADKARRLEGLVAGLAAGMRHGSEADDASGDGHAVPVEHFVRAAGLAKADLVSQVVIEFPTLQGTMGELYARHAGVPEAVARAVGEHYLPLSATAPGPATLAGAVLAVAEKADNIAGAWVAGQKPSGSRDPYGLRRAAMGIVRIALEHDLRVALPGLLAAALDQYEAQGAIEPGDGEHRALAAEMSAFVWERLEALLLDEGLPYPLVEAALGAAVADVPAKAARARAFAALSGSAAFDDVVVAYNRCFSIASKGVAPAQGAAASSAGGATATSPATAPSAATRPAPAVDPARFTAPIEAELASALAAAAGPVRAALAGLDVEGAVAAAAPLRGPVDRYFDDVLVMDPDPAVRANRLAQLAAVVTLLIEIGDLSRLPVPAAS